MRNRFFFKRSNNANPQTWELSLVGDWDSWSNLGSSQTRTHDAAHEFTSFTGATSGTLTYDVKGNLLTRPASLQSPALTLTWDFDNRMQGADTDGTPKYSLLGGWTCQDYSENYFLIRGTFSFTDSECEAKSPKIPYLPTTCAVLTE